MANIAFEKIMQMPDDDLIARDREEADQFGRAWFGGISLTGIAVALALVAATIYIATRI